MNAAEITAAEGGDWYRGYGLVPGIGHSPRDRSVKIWDGDCGEVMVHSFIGQDWRTIKAAWRARGYLPQRDKFVDLHPKRQRQDKGTIDPVLPDLRALAIWRAAVPIAATLAEKYLRHRGITTDLPPSLRFDGSLDYFDGDAAWPITLPALIAGVQAPDRRVVAVHRTYIRPDGTGKAQVTSPKKLLGSCSGGAVRLAAATDILGIAEGIEDGLSAMSLAGLPVWCALGVGRFASINIPAGVATVHIFAQNDPLDSEARKAVDRAIEHFSSTRTVVIRRPPERFKDWNAWHQAGRPER